ncbi:mycofactocin-coupled SDR family oxidoreductase [Mycobacterium marseillense]|uniref:mycofactocin-coupled SDR family oxidoreductase n=1 Tax=Mycobacterium marseillense TaxID=701042 RepID=UPI0011A40DAD|nr:mycofactocin-coupled SDR family oxidoreductase [Mycobacterium marseillense]
MGIAEGKVAFITGAARGQGRSHAVALAAEGADIIASDLAGPVATAPYPMATEDDLAETVRLIEGLGRKCIAAKVDVRDLPGLIELAERGMHDFGRIDIVLGNAGISNPAPTLEMTSETWSEMIDINLTGVFNTVRAAAPHIVAGARGGSIVLTSSLATFDTSPTLSHYTAAKAGVVGLMQVLAKELAPHSVRVNTVHPGTIATAMVMNDSTYRVFRPDLARPAFEDFIEATKTFNALPVSILEPADVTNAILYLISDAGRYITGTQHLIDAGAALI